MILLSRRMENAVKQGSVMNKNIYFNIERDGKMEEQKKDRDGQPGWNKKPITKEQQEQVKEQYKAYRSKIYGEYPQVERFEKNKKRWIGFLILMRLFLLMVTGYVQEQAMQGPIGLLIIGLILGVLPSLLILSLALAPKWQFACILYLLAAQQIMNFINMLSEIGIRSLGDFVWSVSEGFRQNPFLISLDVISWIYVLLILLTAIWLTVLPRSRKLAGQSEELVAQLKNFRPTGI